MTICSNPGRTPAFERLLEYFTTGGQKTPAQKWESSIRAHRQDQHRLSPTSVEDLVKGYSSGSTVYELASRFDIRRQTVSKILMREGISLRRQPLTQDQVQTAQELYSAGLSCQSIAELLECNNGTVRLALVKAGTKMRDSHGRARNRAT